MKNNGATFESVWATLQEIAERQKKADMQMIESRAEFDKRMKESDEKFDKRMRESDEKFEKSRAEADMQMKNLREMVGGMGNSNGMFAEEFFVNSIKNGDKKLFGEQFDECERSSRRNDKGTRTKSEQDVLLINGDAVALIEVKYKARREDVQKLIDRLPVFKALYPKYQSHRIYLGLATMAFDKGVEAESEKEGIALLKQVGDTLVVNDKNLKVF